MADLVKISANLPDNLVGELKRLAATRNTTVTEVLRDAIANEIFLDHQVRNGAKLLIKRPDEDMREVIYR